MELFHGGCHGCAMQEKNGLGFCVGCMYFEADWTLPDLNDEHAREEARQDGVRTLARKLALTNKK